MFSGKTTSVQDMAVLAERPLPELEDELAALSSHLSAGMARWLEVLAEFDLRLGLEGLGWLFALVGVAVWAGWSDGS